MISSLGDAGEGTRHCFGMLMPRCCSCDRERETGDNNNMGGMVVGSTNDSSSGSMPCVPSACAAHACRMTCFFMERSRFRMSGFT